MDPTKLLRMCQKYLEVLYTVLFQCWNEVLGLVQKWREKEKKKLTKPKAAHPFIFVIYHNLAVIAASCKFQQLPLGSTCRLIILSRRKPIEILPCRTDAVYRLDIPLLEYSFKSSVSPSCMFW